MLPEVFDFDEIDEEFEIQEKSILHWDDLALGFDFDKGEFILSDGDIVLLSKKEMIKQWIDKVFRTNQGKYEIYLRRNPMLREYGTRLKEIYYGRRVPRLYFVAEMEREIEETLLMNPLIHRIDNFEFEQKGTYLYISFEVILVEILDDRFEYKLEVRIPHD